VRVALPAEEEQPRLPAPANGGMNGRHAG